MCSKRNTKKEKSRDRNPEGIENYEISIDYVNTGGSWNRNEMENMN